MEELEHLARIRVSDAPKMHKRSISALITELRDDITMAEVAQMSVDELRRIPRIGPAGVDSILKSIRIACSEKYVSRRAIDVALALQEKKSEEKKSDE